MVDFNFLPSVAQDDIDRTVQLILQASNPSDPSAVQAMNQEMFELQKRPEAWGLFIPLLSHQDQFVQFFGAHTVQVKITRDWETFPSEHEVALKDVLVQLTAHCIMTGKAKVVLRKLFVALSSLAMKLVTRHPTPWPDWILACVTTFSGTGAPAEHIHDFLTIVAEECQSASLIGSSKARLSDSLRTAAPMVVQAVNASISSPNIAEDEVDSALHSLRAWLPTVPTNDTIPLIPRLISLLDPDRDTVFIAASDTLQEIMSKTALSTGGYRTLTEPLLFWLCSEGMQILEQSIQSEMVDSVSLSLCKLASALGDHSTTYISESVGTADIVNPPIPLQPGPSQPALQPTVRDQLAQTFLRMMLAYTGFPGYFGVDEEVSDNCIAFWYLFQEALWGDTEAAVPPQLPDPEARKVTTTALYVEVVKVLKRKVTFPPAGHGWHKDQIQRFRVYRRDVGDTLINAYYIIRDDMLYYLIDDVVQRLSGRKESDGWEDIEATLHCLLSVQEALDYSQCPQIGRLFSPEVMGKLPTTGDNRVRRTALSLIDTYSSWFTVHPNTSALIAVVGFVVSALTEPKLCLQAASALCNLCDANRKTLAPHIGAFAELHAGIGQIPDSERSKVLQSIASVIQALPPSEGVPAVEALVNPVVQKLAEILNAPGIVPSEVHAAIVVQLETLSGIVKGLTRTTRPENGLILLQFEDDDDPEVQKEIQLVEQARLDPRLINLRQTLLAATARTVELHGTDASVALAINELFKSITSLPSDQTLISLPPAPLLELVCAAAQRQLTASWLTLAGILIGQLYPGLVSFPLEDPVAEAQQQRERARQKEEADTIVGSVLPLLLSATLHSLGQSNAMEENPDIVQEFFKYLYPVADNHVQAFYTLPAGALDALLQCAIRALELQERYSLTSACAFLSKMITKSFQSESLVPIAQAQLVAPHGRTIMRAVLSGIAGTVPRSVVPNLVDLLSTLLSKWVDESKVWLREILFGNEFVSSKATPEAKEKFVKAVLGSRSIKKAKEAANQFTLVARGLEGSGFGQASGI